MHMTEGTRVEVLTLGECMIRLAAPPGQLLEHATSLDVHVGGAEANVAVALARMGRSVAWMSQVADDPFGRRIVGELRRHGVNCDPVRTVSSGRTGRFYTESGGAPRGVTVHYDRAGSAAAAMSVASLDLSWIERTAVVEFSGITPALSESCAELCTEVLAVARRTGARRVIDVNYRSRLWGVERARAVLAPLCAASDVVLCTAEDARDLFAMPEPNAAELAKQIGVATVVLTEGARGVSWHTADDDGFLPAIHTDTFDRIGAGDAFCAGVITGLLDGDLRAGIRRGQAMASLARTTAGDLFVCTGADVEAALAAEGRADRR